jgi:hypothetical protein
VERLAVLGRERQRLLEQPLRVVEPVGLERGHAFDDRLLDAIEARLPGRLHLLPEGRGVGVLFVEDRHARQDRERLVALPRLDLRPRLREQIVHAPSQLDGGRGRGRIGPTPPMRRPQARGRS